MFITIMSLALALALCLPATGGVLSVAAADASVLALTAPAFPAGATVTASRVDMTPAAVNAEGFFGNPDTHGALYERLRFGGSLFESVRLPRFKGADRQIWLLSTLFPSAAAARQAFAADGQISGCAAKPAVVLPIRAATCSYVDTKGPESGLYVVATTSNVEFIVLGFVEKASAAAGAQALRDASGVARNEARHVIQLLALGPLRVVPSPVLRTVRVGASPYTIVADQQAGHVLVMNDDSSSVSMLDARTGALLHTTPTGLMGIDAMALDGRAGRLFLSDGTSTVTVLNTRTGAVVRTIDPDGATSFQSAGVDELTGHVFMADTFGVVYMLDARSGATLHTTNVGKNPDAVAVDPRLSRAFVANRDSNSVTVLDTRTGAAIWTIGVGPEPMFMAADARTGRVFVVNANAMSSAGDATISILDAHSGAVVRTVPLPGAFRLAVDEPSGHVFVIDGDSDTQRGGVAMLDARTGVVQRIIPLGVDPTALAVDARRGRVFVANAGDNTVSVLDAGGGAVLGTYPVGKRPASVAVDEATDRAFVANGDGNSVSVLDAAVGR